MSSPPPLRYAILELGLRCNLACLHCASGSGRPRPHELDLAAWQQVVADLAQLGCGAVDLMGGEVLLSPLLEPVGAALQRAGLGWGMLTNGWLLDRARARRLVGLGCGGVGVSLDGADAATHDQIRGRQGAFARALDALEVVAELDFIPRNRAVLTSVSQRNIDQLPAMGQLLSRRFAGFRWQLNLCSAEAPRLPEELRLDADGVARVVDFVHRARSGGTYDLLVTAAHDVGYLMEHQLDLHDHAWDGCPAGVHHLGVQSDGLVKGCLALAPDFAVGSVTETRLLELWHDAARWRVHREVDLAELGPGCEACVWGARCKGGCTAYSAAYTGQRHNHPHCLWREASPEQRAGASRGVLAATSGTPYCAPDEPLPEATLAAGDDASGAADQWELPLSSTCIELTLRCNLSCLHCGSAAHHGRRQTLDLAAFVPLLRDLHLLGGQRVVLLGGEPLLHPDWAAVVQMAAGFQLEVALISNGTLINDAVADQLAELPLTHVGLSLDGATDEVHDRIRGVPGSRRKVWAALERLRERDVEVTLITTLNQLNLPQLPQLRDQLAAPGGLVWQLQAANGTGDRFSDELMLTPAGILQAARMIQQTRQQLSSDQLAVAGGHNIGHHGCTVTDHGTRGAWQGCPGGVTAAGVCADGSVKGCLSMRPDAVVGNIHQRTLAEIWRDPRSFADRRTAWPGKLQGGCASCPHGSTCRAGCPEMARTGTGGIWDNPFCVRQAETDP